MYYLYHIVYQGFFVEIVEGHYNMPYDIYIYIYINNITTHHKVDLDPWNGRESNLQHSESI